MKHIAVANDLADLLLEVLEENGDWDTDPEKWVHRVNETLEKLDHANEIFEMESDVIVEVLASIEYDSRFNDGGKDYARVDRSKIDGLLELLCSTKEIKH